MKRRSKWAKKCSECGKIIASHNKSLLCEYHIKEKYYKEHPEQFKATKKRYYEKNRKEIIRKQTEYNQLPHVKLKRKVHSKRYREKNKDKIKEYEKEYYQKKKLEKLQDQQNPEIVTTLK